MIKNILYSILFIVVTVTNVTAGNDLPTDKANAKLVSGKVIDKLSGEELAGVEIKIEGKTLYTDLNGNFTTTIFENKTEATVKFVSYTDTKITVDAYSYNSLIVELESR